MEVLNRHKSNIWKLYTIALLGGFAFFYNSIETLYYRHFGLSFQQIGYLISATLLTNLILDIPTGAFADLYGRKLSLLIATALNFLAVSFLVVGSSFSLFLVGFIIWGAGRAFSSGASSALLYDSLKALGHESSFTKHTGRMSSLFISVDIISGTVGPLMFAYYLRLPYIISWLSLGFVLLFQLTLYEKTAEKKHIRNPLKAHTMTIVNSVKLAFTNRLFVWLTCFTLLFFLINKVFSEMISSPFLIQIGYTLPLLSIIGLIGNIIQTSLTFFADKIERWLGDFTSFLSLVICIPIIFILYSFSRNIVLTGILVGLYYSLVSFSEVITQSYLNHHIANDNRATMLSIGSMAVSFLSLLALPFFGFFTDKTSPQYSLWLLSGLVFFCGLILMIIRPKKITGS